MLENLSAETLRWTLSPRDLKCDSSRDLKPLEGIVGQDRAIRSLKLGLEIRDQGFNVYVAGPPGTGKTTSVKRFLEEVSKQKKRPGDWCYVNNFREPYRPKTLAFPPGKVREFQTDVQNLVESIRREIRKSFESEEYEARKEGETKTIQQQKEELFRRLNEEAQKEGFVIQMTPMGIVTIPLRDGKPMSNEDLLSLKPEEKEEINRKGEKLQDRLKAVFRQIRSLDRSAVEELQKIDRQVALFTLGPLIEDLKEKYSDNPAVVNYLEEMQEDMLENLNLFRQEGQSPQAALPFPIPGAGDLPFRKYRVNALIDNSKTEGAPVVMELNPTYNNLFGRLEKEAQFGALFTDFTMIREGALHRANGGYLVMPVEEVFRNLFSWESLKRALRNKEINIEEPGERLGFLTTKSLKPQPVPLDIRVILIGTSFIYHLLYELDADFRELFKVKAHFDTVMDRTDENIRYYLGYICRICEEEKLKHLDSSALTKILEHGVKLAEDQQKLSTRFGEIADIIREAGFYASRDGAELVSGTHVRKAIEEKIYRSNLIQEKIGEMIEQNALKIDVDGAQVGQVNGLSVIDLGDLAFGRPNRITASIGMGREGLIDIEREAKLGGPIHTKGVMILSGYLAGKYAQDRPLSLAARLVFEQSYSGVEGDSASSTELYAILSSLSELPIHQGIAVTGSVNQKGEVQAIGGVNEKIEGFYEVCRAKGLTGRQGVMIPKSNVRNLMLKEEIVEKVRDEKFHIWAVDSIDEGIEILTGRKAGEKKDGKFEEGSVNNLIERQLKHLSETMREYAGPDGARKEKSAGEEAEKRVPA